MMEVEKNRARACERDRTTREHEIQAHVLLKTHTDAKAHKTQPERHTTTQSKKHRPRDDKIEIGRDNDAQRDARTDGQKDGPAETNTEKKTDTNYD